MKDERTMILNMLKEGKISVEEAEALLEVLGEDAESPGGFAAAAPAADDDTPLAGGGRPGDGGSANRPAPAQASAAKGAAAHGSGAETADDAREEKRGGRRKGFNFDFDLDLGGLKETLREAMKGVSETVRGVTEGLADLDIGGEIFRTMGKIRAQDTQEVSRESGDSTGLAISNRWGDVRVTGTDGSAISVSAEAAAWGADDADARATLERLAVDLVRDGDTWHVKSGLESEPSPAVRIDYVIAMPRRLRAQVSSASGDIWLEDLEGRQEVTTLSGDVALSNLGLDAEVSQVVKTRSGDVVGGALTGDVSLSTLSGDVEINGFTGVLRVSTKSGDVTVRAGTGSIHAKTLSGDVNVELASLGAEPVEVTSVSGDIVLAVPAGSAVDLSARSTSGDVRAAMELDVEKRGDHVLVGKANGGGLPVTATSVSGDITVSEA